MIQSDIPILQKLINHYKLAIFVSLVLFALLALSPFAFVNIAVTGPGADNADIGLYQNNEVVSTLKNGLNIVRVGDYTLRAKSGDKFSEASVNLRPFRLNKKALELKAQTSVVKVASGSLGCVYSAGSLVSSDKVYLYSCEQAKNVFSYSTSGKKPQLKNIYDSLVYSPTPFKDGMLGIVSTIGGDDSTTQVVYFGPEEPTYTNLGTSSIPSGLKVLGLSSNNDQETNEFVIADKGSKELTYFKNPGDTKPQKVAYKIEGNNFQFSSSGKFVFVYGATRESTKASEQDLQTGLTKGQLNVYSTESGTLKEINSIRVADDQELLSSQAIDYKTLATRDLQGKVKIYKINGSRLENYDAVGSTDFYAAIRGGLVYCRLQDCFSYDAASRSSHLVHSLNSKFTIAGVQSTDGQFVINVLVKGANDKHSFVLTDQPRTNSIERILAYPSETSYITSIDYNDSSIFVEFALSSFTSNSQTGRFSYDKKELEDKKSALSDKLRAYSPDLARYKIIATN